MRTNKRRETNYPNWS